MEEDRIPLNDTPTGQARRWAMEFDAARKELKKWHEQGEKANKAYLDDRESDTLNDTRWNIFHQNVSTELDMVRGNLPRTAVSRKFADADDDIARVSSLILERIINADVERSEDSFAEAAWQALQDYKIPGAGFLRWRYVCETTPVEGAPPDEEGNVPEVKIREDIESDYLYWKDILWSPSRTHADWRWVAFQTFLSRTDAIERFGEEIVKVLPMSTKKERDGDKHPKETPWGRIHVWEIWDKERKEVTWYVEGYATTLETKPDPLQLPNFWPMPKPMLANLTTTKNVPKPTYLFAKGLYQEIDELSTRIKLLQEAVRVAGAYDKSSKELKNLLSKRRENILVPVENWGVFVEKGGIQGSVSWMPLDQVVNALNVLRDVRRELVETVNQLTGVPDVMRGQAQDAAKTATATRGEMRSASVKVRASQEEFARFCSDALRVKAEIIVRHFDDATILERSNVMSTPDAQYAEQAVQLLRQDLAPYRIEVKPESVSMTDFDAIKAQRTDVLNSISGAVQAMAPILATFQGGLPFGLKLLQWFASGLQGGKEIEGVIDQAIQAAEAEAQQPQGQQPPSPQEKSEQLKLVVSQSKAQADMAKIQAKHMADMQRIQAESEANARKEEVQRRENVLEAMEKRTLTEPGGA